MMRRDRIVPRNEVFGHVRSISPWAEDNTDWHVYADHIARRNKLSVRDWALLHDGFVAGYRAGIK
jgi:hypothetical protein